MDATVVLFLIYEAGRSVEIILFSKQRHLHYLLVLKLKLDEFYKYKFQVQ